MTRQHIIEQIRRQIYGGYPPDDATITEGLVNQYLDQGLAVAAKKNYTDNFQLDGVGYVNNSFYSTFKNIPVTEDEMFLYKMTLPEIPLGIGSVDAISRAVFKGTGNVSYPLVLLSQSQVAIQRQMRRIPNKVVGYTEGSYLYAITTIPLTQYTLSVTMVSGGDSSDMTSLLNVPNDYIPLIVEYIKAQVLFERSQPVDAANDGSDAVKTT